MLTYPILTSKNQTPQGWIVEYSTEEAGYLLREGIYPNKEVACTVAEKLVRYGLCTMANVRHQGESVTYFREIR